MNKKRFLLWILAFACSLLLLSFYGGPLPYTIFALVLLVPVSCLIYIWIVIASIKIYQRSDGRDMICREPSDFYITLQNEGLIPFSSLRLRFFSSFSTITDLKDSVVYELPPHSSVVKKTRLLCRYRGVYDVGLKQIEVKDFLGLFCVTYRIREPLNIIVSPAKLRISALEDEKTGPDSFREKLTDRTEPDIPVREYVPGDEVRFIHWKSTAVMQKLMIRERIGEEKNGIAIVMDSIRISEKPEEYLPPENDVMERVISLALYYMEKGIPVDVYVKDGEVLRFPILGAGDFDAFYEKMKRFLFRKENERLPFLAELFSEGAFGSCRFLILVMQQWTGEEDEMLESLNEERIPVKLYRYEKEETP